MLYIIFCMIFCVTLYYVRYVFKIKSIPVKLIYIEIMYNFFIKFLEGYLGLPSILNYVTDLILILLVFYYFMQKKAGFRRRVPISLLAVFIIYLTVAVASYIVNIYNPVLFVWGVRNNMRFIIFAMMCAVYLKMDDIYKVMDMTVGYFILNIPVITYEYFFAGLTFRTGDVISGLYSVKTTQGGNGELNWLICIVATYAIIQYLNKEKKVGYLLFCLGGSFYMAALSELKVFFIEIIVIALICVYCCKKSLKMVGFVMIGIIMLIVGIQLLYLWFPKFQDFFALANLKANIFTSESYNTESGMSRTGAVEYVMNHYLKDFSTRVLGIGFGNADYSGFDFLTSNFYKVNSKSSYMWFYAPFILVETGILGLVSYLLIIINFIRKTVKIKNYSSKIQEIKLFNIVIGGLAVIMLFYNQSLKTETAGYLVYFILVIPYIIERSYIFNRRN